MKFSIQYYIDLAVVLTQKELKARYKNSFLGYLWSIGNPLVFAAVFYVAFKVIMKIEMEDYPFFVVTGLFPWQWFSNSVSSSSVVFLKNTSMVKKVNFAKNFLPLATTFSDMIHFVLSIPIVFVLLVIYHRPFHLSYVYGIPLLLVLQLLLTYGLCLIVSTITLFFRDMERLILIILMLLFYVTPIVYPEQMVPAHFTPLIYANPQALLIINWRSLLFNGTIVPELFLATCAYTALVLAMGQFVYRKLCYRFAEIV